MRKRTRLRAVGWTVISTLCLLGTLILQGCGENEPSPYAELDEKFPNGRPGIVDLETRTQDAAYMAKLQAGAKEISNLQAAATAAANEAEFFKKQLIDLLAKRVGETPHPALVTAELEKNDHYQNLLKKAEAAQAAVMEQIAANRKVIRERMWADAAAYDAMRAEADAKAKAAGLSVRESAPTQSSQPARPTAKPLSETEGTSAEAGTK